VDTWGWSHNYPVGEVEMKIVIAFVVACFASFFFGYIFRDDQIANQPLPFKILRIIHPSDSDAVSRDGRMAPFTVLVYEKMIQIKRPGMLGEPGDEILMARSQYENFIYSQPERR
jgi:hypothetical protein